MKKRIESLQPSKERESEMPEVKDFQSLKKKLIREVVDKRVKQQLQGAQEKFNYKAKKEEQKLRERYGVRMNQSKKLIT